MRPRRVLVLGGGAGGVAAAWALSRTAELRRAYEITLVQPGWRLGGKGATGRDPRRGDRILEHGLHLWLGFYRTAFRMIRDVYDAWERASDGPLRSLETAFSPLFDVTLCGGLEDAPELWRLRFPELPGRPWDDAPPPLLDWPSVVAGWARGLPFVFASAPLKPGWSAQRLRTVAGLGAVIGRGLSRDIGTGGEAGWQALDEEDLRAWLRRHGATAAEADSPPIRALYDLGFAYPDGVAAPGRGAVAAGAGLRTLLKIFGGYRGAPFWRMNAGMGDTVFAPLWDVLCARGVRFRLFHRVEQLHVEGGGISAVDLGVQATGHDPYRPLVKVRSIRAWPGAPCRDQLDAVAGGDLEADDGPTLGRITLRRGADFDDVVLAIPATVHRRIAGELMAASPRYRAMVEHTHAVPTVAAQLWLARSAGELGFAGAPAVLTGLPGLFRTWADLGEIVDAETWADRPASLAYLCNVAPPDLHALSDRTEAGRRVAEQMRRWASGPLLQVWPAARAARGGFDDGALHAPYGEDPWAFQYARANVAGWERYVLSLPGTTRHRLAPDQSGFDNLVLAGDWTRNIINGGSVEGAVWSGVRAAEARDSDPTVVGGLRGGNWRPPPKRPDSDPTVVGGLGRPATRPWLADCVAETGGRHPRGGPTVVGGLRGGNWRPPPTERGKP